MSWRRFSVQALLQGEGQLVYTNPSDYLRLPGKAGFSHLLLMVFDEGSLCVR